MANGDILAVRILGSTTTVADALSACNVASAGTGWVAEIDVAGLSTGGTYALGIGANNSPATAKIVLTVTSSGYDATGALGTTTRTVYGTHQLRRVYNVAYTPPYPNDETLVSSTLTLRIALSDAIYSGDTVVANIASGIYTQGGTPTNAAGNLAATNNSTLTYSQARVIANWSWPGFSRITGNTLTVRAVGFHRHAKNGKPLACMKFTATDAHSHTATVTVTDMTIDGSMSDAGGKVQEYIGTLDVSTFTQGDLVTVNFAAYPWVGDATAVMDTSDGVNTMPTPLYAPQYYICDRLGTFGTAVAVVDAATGNDSTAVAVSESAFNGVNDGATLAPCATINKAAVLIRAWNAANSSPARTDVAGTIYIKAGNYKYTGATVAIGASSGTNPDKSWLTITTFPGVASSAVVIDGVTSTTYNKIGTTPLHVKGITVNIDSTTTPTAAPTHVFQANSSAGYLWLQNNRLTMTSGTTLAYTYGAVYWTGNIVVSNSEANGGTTATCVKNGFNQYGSTAPAALIRGNTMSGIANVVNAYTFLGNLYAPTTLNTAFQLLSPQTAIPVISTAPIIAFNKLMNLGNSSGGNPLFGTLTSPIGAVVANNIYEWNSSSAQNPISVASDGSTGTPVNNVMLWANTIAGQRINRGYNDSGTVIKIRTLWSERGNLWDASAIKSDTFSTPNANRVGNWACLYGVGWDGNMDAASPAFAQAGQWQPEFFGLYADSVAIGTSRDAQASNQAPRGTARTLTYPAFVGRASWDGTNPGTGNGDYHIQATSPAIGLIKSTFLVLPYDLDGVARRNDGTGAAGAYEYPVAAISGAGSVTLGDVSSTATATLPVQGTAGASLHPATLAAIGTLPLSGVLSATVDSAVSASGSLLISGQSATALAEATAEASGSVGTTINTGSAIVGLQDASAAAAASLDISAQAAISTGAVIVSSASTLLIRSQALLSLAAASLAGLAQIRNAGEITPTPAIRTHRVVARSRVN